MNARDNLLALSVALVWGVTFIAIKIGVFEAPPLLFTALRFAFAALPAAFFIRPPKADARLVSLYGLLIGVGQFGLLFLAINRGMPVGLASLVIQLQAFVTIFLAWALMGERPSRVQLIAASLALAGIAVIASQRLAGASLAPFLMVLAASACWGMGNFVGKKIGRVDALALMVWSSLAPPLVMFGLSLIFEGGRTLPALMHPSWVLAICVLVVAYGGTLYGYTVWSALLAHHRAAEVAPFALLVPVVGMAAGRVIFDEPTSAIEIFGAILVMAGLSFNVFGARTLTPAPLPNGRGVTPFEPLSRSGEGQG